MPQSLPGIRPKTLDTHTHTHTQVRDDSYLVISGGVRDNEEAWLAKSLLDLVGEGPGSEPASDGDRSSVVSKLQDGPL